MIEIMDNIVTKPLPREYGLVASLSISTKIRHKSDEFRLESRRSKF